MTSITYGVFTTLLTRFDGDIIETRDVTQLVENVNGNKSVMSIYYARDSLLLGTFINVTINSRRHDVLYVESIPHSVMGKPELFTDLLVNNFFLRAGNKLSSLGYEIIGLSSKVYYEYYKPALIEQRLPISSPVPKISLSIIQYTLGKMYYNVPLSCLSPSHPEKAIQYLSDVTKNYADYLKKGTFIVIAYNDCTDADISIITKRDRTYADVSLDSETVPSNSRYITACRKIQNSPNLKSLTDTRQSIVQKCIELEMRSIKTEEARDAFKKFLDDEYIKYNPEWLELPKTKAKSKESATTKQSSNGNKLADSGDTVDTDKKEKRNCIVVSFFSSIISRLFSRRKEKKTEEEPPSSKSKRKTGISSKKASQNKGVSSPSSVGKGKKKNKRSLKNKDSNEKSVSKLSSNTIVSTFEKHLSIKEKRKLRKEENIQNNNRKKREKEEKKHREEMLKIKESESKKNNKQNKKNRKIESKKESQDLSKGSFNFRRLKKIALIIILLVVALLLLLVIGDTLFGGFVFANNAIPNLSFITNSSIIRNI